MEDYTVDEWAGQAVMSLTKGSEVCISIEDGKLTHWELIKGDAQKPTEQEISDEVTRLKGIYDAQAYARSRKESYPPATDYLDGIVKGDQAQIDKYIADCLAVKERFPK